MFKFLLVEWMVFRIRLGAWIIGQGALSDICLMTIIRARAESAISKTGQVDLAECKKLADILYRPIEVYSWYHQQGYYWTVRPRPPVDTEPQSLKLVK